MTLPPQARELQAHAGDRERRRRVLSVFVVPLLAAALYLVLPADPLGHPGRAAAAMALWMAGWWVTEAIPLAATALLPVALFPALGVATAKQATAPYGHKVIFLFMGGFMMAQAMERWGLHRRVALLTVRAVGTSPRRLVGGFMLAVAFLSMWVSNTATVIMMIPTGISVVDLVASRTPDDPAARRDTDRFAAALLLGIAYASSIGGVGTLIGTPPNVLMAAFVERTYGEGLGFGAWMRLGVPVVVGFVPVAWWLLTRVAFPFELEEIPGGAEMLDAELAELGPMKRAEKLVLGVFSVAALVWITLPWLKAATLPGTALRPFAGFDDSSVGVLGALALFLVPAGTPDGERVLSWEVAKRLPWGILLLFGGGLSLAAAMSRCGLAAWLGAQFSALGDWPPAAIVLALTAAVIVLTEFTSNTATTAALMPVLDGVARGIDVHPYLLMLPAVFAASCAFMLPAATAPNAIALGSGRVTLRQMMRGGAWLNVFGVVYIAGACYLLAPWALGVDLAHFPAEWSAP